MSKIVILAENISEIERVGAIDRIVSLSHKSIVEVKECIMDKNPLAEIVLYEDQYAQKVKEIKQWIHLAEQKHIKLKFYVLEPDMNFNKLSNTNDYLISQEELIESLDGQ